MAASCPTFSFLFFFFCLYCSTLSIFLVVIMFSCGSSKRCKSPDSVLTSFLFFPSPLSLRQGDQCGEEHAERGPGLLWEAVREEAEQQAQKLHAAGGQRGERGGKALRLHKRESLNETLNARPKAECADKQLVIMFLVLKVSDVAAGLIGILVMEPKTQ